MLCKMLLQNDRVRHTLSLCDYCLYVSGYLNQAFEFPSKECERWDYYRVDLTLHKVLWPVSRAMPFLLHYEGTESLRFNFCIDSSSLGNDIRFIRCSCTPNAKVGHFSFASDTKFAFFTTKHV